MLWLVKEETSYEIVSCNIHEQDGIYQVWVTRPNGKSLKIDENVDKKEVIFIKEAIDFAIEKGEKALRLENKTLQQNNDFNFKL